MQRLRVIVPGGQAVMTRSEADRAPCDEATSLIEGNVERETAGLLGYFTRRVSPVEDAADLLAETLLVLWRRADAVPEDPAAARMWTYGVARRILATHRRGATRRNALAHRLRQELSAQPALRDDEDRPLNRLHAALSTLPPLDQEIVRLVHGDELSVGRGGRGPGRRPQTAGRPCVERGGMGRPLSGGLVSRDRVAPGSRKPARQHQPRPSRCQVGHRRRSRRTSGRSIPVVVSAGTATSEATGCSPDA